VSRGAAPRRHSLPPGRSGFDPPPYRQTVGQAFLPVALTVGRHSRRQLMLASGKMVGFIPTKDYDKARAFYEGKLGFQFVSLDKFALVMSVGGHMIRIVKIPSFTPLQGTILGWQVENIESVAVWLRDRGVPPEKYHFAQDQTLGIWTTPDGSKVAWFKDPDGNILSISQHVPRL